jgi:hypothetical protein
MPKERRSTKPEEIRFWAKVVISATGCWLWTRATTKDGYGHFYPTRSRQAVLAHRWAYEFLVGPIPAEKELDHVCRVPACVNPAHLEPVTHRVNCLRGQSPYAKKARQTHCKHGHEFTPENTMIHRGCRECRECERIRGERRWSLNPRNPKNKAIYAQAVRN